MRKWSPRTFPERKPKGGKDSMWRIKQNNSNKMLIITSAQKTANSLSFPPFFALLIENKLKIFTPAPIDWFHSLCPAFYLCF